ncbi:MAG: 3-phenylpropionate/trans-cinnamate dioxygenase ferredoxin component [Bacteroidota bacterium]|nr:3-phenylpropionate/trans-cinnamate dioxygenase ferredoxin component [Bacteroidota bacterium]
MTENIEKNINGINFIRACRSSELHEKKGKLIIIDDDTDMELALFRVGGNLYCLSNICPHEHQPQIYNGIIEDMELICPVHGWTYSLETGQNVEPKRGIKSLKKFEAFESEGWIWVQKPDIEIPLWRQAEL